MNDAHTRIEDAFRRRLELLPKSESRLKIAVDRLASFSVRPTSAVRPEPFRSVGKKKLREELNLLARAADALVARVESLHAPAIDALADRKFTRGPVVQFAKALSDAARSADVSDIDEVAGRGRPKNNLATGVARIIIEDFEELTGKKADISQDRYGDKTQGLKPLVRDVFGVLCISANARAAVEAALEQRKKQRSG